MYSTHAVPRLGLYPLRQLSERATRNVLRDTYSLLSNDAEPKKECRRRCLSPEISLVSNTEPSFPPPFAVSVPGTENGLTNDDESSRVLSRAVEHICLEPGCRVVLNPVGLSSRTYIYIYIYITCTPRITFSSFLSLSHRTDRPSLLHSRERERLSLRVSPFIVVLGTRQDSA